MKKSNLMIVGVAVCMLAACGSSEDIDAVAAEMMTATTSGSDAVSEKDAKCLAKSLKKNTSDDQWNLMVKRANGEIGQIDDQSWEVGMEEAMALLVPYAMASKECDVPLGS